MKRSESIINLVAALAQAQGQFKPALRSRENPHLHNMYATLDDIITAVRGPLHKNGLSIVQPLTGDGEDYLLETILFHESGEWIGSEAIVPVMEGNRAVNALQVFGSSLTYMRRYMLSAMLTINTGEDADGNGATTGKKKTTKKPARARQTMKAKTPKPKPTNGNGTVPPAPNWVDNPDITKRFYTWLGKQTLPNGETITKAQMYEAIGVTSSLKEFKGTTGEAKTLIRKWIAEQSKSAPPEPSHDDTQPSVDDNTIF